MCRNLSHKTEYNYSSLVGQQSFIVSQTSQLTGIVRAMKQYVAGHSSHAAYGMNCLCTLGHWDHGFESHSWHGCLVCVCIYSVFVLFFV
jgi:hypothetical protein